MDIAFLFWSIGAGIVLAAGMIPLAVFGSAVIGLILFVFVNRKAHLCPYIVALQCQNNNVEMKAIEYMKSRVSRLVVKSKTAQKGMIELNMEIRLKDDNTDFVNELAEIAGVNRAVLVSFNGEYMK